LRHPAVARWRQHFCSRGIDTLGGGRRLPPSLVGQARSLTRGSESGPHRTTPINDSTRDVEHTRLYASQRIHLIDSRDDR
jgi:hypothetical protein